MKHELNLRERVAIVTGGARGIGREVAKTYVEHGAKVLICDILEEEGEKTAKELGPAALFVQCDVSRPDEVCAMIATAGRQFGRLDIMVNNAAYNPVRPEERVPVHEYPEDVFRRIMDVDINGTFYCSKYAAQEMIQQKAGSIISIASIAGVVALRNQISHVTAKAAIVRMTQAMALELGGYGIRVNAISPGSTVTDATRDLFYGEDAHSRSFVERLLSFIPMGRAGETPDIAAAALFLASDLSAYITGHNMIVDGGWTCGFTRDF